MHRLIVVTLSAVDAAIAAAVGLVAILAPLTLAWVLVFGGAADWAALWPTAATIWQFGHAVPLTIALPAQYLADTGIDAGAASFVVSLAPLAIATFTAIFAARSGRRASQAGAWITGVTTGTVVFAAASALAALTGAVSIAAVEQWQAMLLPVLFYAFPALGGAIVTEWIEAGDGGVARVRDRLESANDGWGDVAGLIARGSAAVMVALVGVAALGLTVALWARGGEVIALFEASHVDALGATLVTLGQFAYLPTLVVWALSFIAGPGFALGAQTAVGPAGTQLGVIPGIPVLGAIPESTTPWLLLLALLPVAIGAFAGWIVRSRVVASSSGSDPIAPRLTIALGIAVIPAAAVALLAFLASGALGPGTLAEVGPQPGPVALAVGLEVLLGAAILMLSPRHRGHADRQERGDAVAVDGVRAFELDGTAAWHDDTAAWHDDDLAHAEPRDEPASADDTEPIEPVDPATLGTLFGTRPLDARRDEGGDRPSVD